MIKNPPAKAGDGGLIPESGRSPGGGNGNPLPYSCLGNPMDRRAWWAIVHGVTKLDTTERQTHTHTHTTDIENTLEVTCEKRKGGGARDWALGLRGTTQHGKPTSIKI